MIRINQIKLPIGHTEKELVQKVCRLLRTCGRGGVWEKGIRKAMIRINQIKLPIGHTEKELVQKVCRLLRIQEEQMTSHAVARRSIDARRKPHLQYVYTVDVTVASEAALHKKIRDKNIQFFTPKQYVLPEASPDDFPVSPVIVGAGPAGLFGAYALVLRGICPIVLERGKSMKERSADVARFWETGVLDPSSNVQFGEGGAGTFLRGICPIVLERGKSMKERSADVARFWETGVLDPSSNVQFGEGGAGTFSDGKLNTLVKDPVGRNRFVLETLVKFGAPEHILYESKPHIGTDILSDVILAMRAFMERAGARFLFETCLTDYRTKNGRVCAVELDHREWIPADTVVLAIGHSARDTFRMLDGKGELALAAKSFAVGFRVEHPQEMIDLQQYGEIYAKRLPAAPYKVTANLPNGRGVYSFCMCPGGYVVNASSEAARLAVNGMSYSGRDGANANSAVIVSVTPDDFDGMDALAGVRFQEKLEERA